MSKNEDLQEKYEGARIRVPKSDTPDKILQVWAFEPEDDFQIKLDGPIYIRGEMYESVPLELVELV